VHGMVSPEKRNHLGLPLTTLTRTAWRPL